MGYELRGGQVQLRRFFGTSFSGNNKQTVWFIDDAHEYAQDVEVRPGGRVVLGGRTESGPGGTASIYDFALARLEEDGDRGERKNGRRPATIRRYTPSRS